MAVWDGLITAEEREIFARAGMGVSTGWGVSPAVLVVDMTHAFVDDEFPLGYARTGRPALAAIKQLLDVARTRKIPVIYSKNNPWTRPVDRGRWKNAPDPRMRDPRAAEIMEEIAPQPDDLVITKGKPSVFFGTHLPAFLTYYHVDTCIVTGMVTSGCVRATVVDAFSYNYHVIVPEECVADRGQTSHAVALFDIQMKYGDVVPLATVTDYVLGLRAAAGA